MFTKILLVIAGIAAHVGYFKHGEHHLYALRYLQIICGVALLSTAGLMFTHSMASRPAFAVTASLIGYYLSGIYASLITYRLLFHPLRKFPGPLSMKISSLGLSARMARLNGHVRHQKLHEKYGEYLRVGSSDLSISNPKAMEVIYGRKSKCQKAEWYDLTKPMTSMQTTRDRAEHDQRRNVWASAFSDSASKGYQGRIAQWQSKLCDKIAASPDKSLNLTELFNQFSFDVMGDISFGISLNMLESDGGHSAIKLLRKGMALLGLMFPTWLFRLLLAIPGATAEWFAFRDYCCEMLDERMKTESKSANMASFLIAPWKGQQPKGHDLLMLQGDSQLIIVAGSDTTASTLAGVFYELCKHPEIIKQLREELRGAIGDDEEISDQKLQPLSLLNGVINETLRLHPSAGLCLPRKTPPEGIEIDGTFIPGDMTVYCPQYVVNRNPKAYTHPHSFLPSRWFSNTKATTSPSSPEGLDPPPQVLEPTAFAPFSLGTYNCVGRNLALMTLRTTIARVVLGFDIAFAEGETGERFERDGTSQFTTTPGGFWGILKKRGC